MKNYINYKKILENAQLLKALEKTDKEFDQEFFDNYICLDRESLKKYKLDTSYSTPYILLEMEVDWLDDFLDIGYEDIMFFLNVTSHYPSYEYYINENEIEYEFNDENTELVENILDIFNDEKKKDYSDFNWICELVKTTSGMVSKIFDDVRFINEQRVINEGNKIYRKLPFEFGSCSEEGVDIEIKISNIDTTIFDLLESSKSDVAEINNFEYDSEIDDKDYENLQYNIKENLKDIYKYMKENKDEYLNILFNEEQLQTISITGMKNDISKKCLTFEFQERFINKDNNKVKNYKYLEKLKIINIEIIEKFKYLVTANDFNL